MTQFTEAEKKTRRKQLFALLEQELPPLAEVPIPDAVKEASWFKDSGIQKILSVYAFVGGRMRAANGKLPAVFKAWLIDEEEGKFKNRPIVIGPTSGNWGLVSGLVASVFNVKGFKAVIGSDVPEGKRAHLQTSGAGIIVAPEGVSPIDYANKLAKKPGYHLINQYTHRGTYEGGKWTMSHIDRELRGMKKKPSIFAAVTGTCGTLMAADLYLRKARHPKLKIFGVAAMSKAENVPGSRYPEKLAALKKIGGFPYEEIIELPLITSVTRDRAYALNAELYQKYFFSVGPTAALLIAGFYDRLREHYERGTIDSLKNKDGKIVAVLYFMDMHLPYLGDPEYLKFFQR
ncbi:MAG: PLP-dependent lyase/thiolase [Minisyncoccota bacterium]